MTRHYVETLNSKQEAQERVRHLKKAYGDQFTLIQVRNYWAFCVWHLVYTLES